MASHDIVIGSINQSASGHDIKVGDDVSLPTLLQFSLPTTRIGTVLVIVVARNSSVLLSDLTWTQVGSYGTSGLFLDVFVRQSDGTPGSRGGDIVGFLSLTHEELTGSLVTLSNANVNTVIDSVVYNPFVTDSAPAAPDVTAQQAEDTILTVFSMSSVVTATAPPNFTTLDTYNSNLVAGRTLLVAAKPANTIDTISPGSASLSAAASGTAWTLVLHFQPAEPLLINPTPEVGLPLAPTRAAARLTPVSFTVNNPNDIHFAIWIKFANEERGFVVYDSVVGFLPPFNSAQSAFRNGVMTVLQAGGWQDTIEFIACNGGGDTNYMPIRAGAAGSDQPPHS